MTRTARPHRYKLPDRDKIRSVFVGLIEEKLSLEEISDWASEYFIFENPQIYPEINDSVVLSALSKLFGSDLEVSKGKRFHTKDDIQAWFEEFEGQCAQT